MTQCFTRIRKLAHRKGRIVTPPVVSLQSIAGLHWLLGDFVLRPAISARAQPRTGRIRHVFMSHRLMTEPAMPAARANSEIYC
jgi:hypothetical protein